MIFKILYFSQCPLHLNTLSKLYTTWLILISEAHCLTISLQQQNRSDDHKIWVTKSIIPPKDWVTGSILSSKTYSGWWIQFCHPESWVKISIRSPKLWVTVLILLPKFYSRQNNTTTLTSWADIVCDYKDQKLCVEIPPAVKYFWQLRPSLFQGSTRKDWLFTQYEPTFI